MSTLMRLCCCCGCTTDAPYVLTLPDTIVCHITGSIGINNFSWGITLMRSPSAGNECIYRTYIGDIEECGVYPYFEQQSFEFGVGLSTTMTNDIFGANCNRNQCGATHPPGGPYQGLGTCLGQDQTVVSVIIKKNYTDCNCWRAEIEFHRSTRSDCADDCTWETRTDCTDTIPRTGFTAHSAVNTDIVPVKNTEDGSGQFFDGDTQYTNNISAQWIHDGGHATYCPSSTDINNLCSHRSDPGAGDGEFGNGGSVTLYAHASSGLFGNYTIGNTQPICVSYTTSAISSTRNSTTENKSNCNYDYVANVPSLTYTLATVEVI